MTQTAPSPAMSGTTGPTTPTPRRADIKTFGSALRPLLLDVAIPLGLFYLLTGFGVSESLALIAGGGLPGARSVLALRRSERPDNLSALMVVEFALSLLLLAITGSPRFFLMKESFGTVLFGLWCLAGYWTTRPVTYYTARPFVTRGDPASLAAWERLGDSSSPFQSIQRRLTVIWGFGLLAEAGVRIWIALHFPVHTAVWMTNIPAIGIITGLCILSGPLGGASLDRMVRAEVARASEPARAG